VSDQNQAESDQSGSGEKAKRRGDSHVKEHVLVLLAGGDGDLLQLDDGRDLGAGVLLLGRAVLRWVGHGAVAASRVLEGCVCSSATGYCARGEARERYREGYKAEEAWVGLGT
jgi:hypothetical protein